jgi:hypothetical protein
MAIMISFDRELTRQHISVIHEATVLDLLLSTHTSLTLTAAILACNSSHVTFLVMLLISLFVTRSLVDSSIVNRRDGPASTSIGVRIKLGKGRK